MDPVSMLQEASTVNGIARNTPRINASLEYRQEDHQSTMLEVEGKILNALVSILIDVGASLSYIAPRVVKKCTLTKENRKLHSWYN